MKHQRVVWMLLLATACLSAGAQDFRGRCVGVSSGDTLEVMKGPRRVTVHLAGVAAPEPAQPFAEDARKALAAAALDRVLAVAEKFSDRGGVIHGVVWAAADTTATLNGAMVAGGLGWCDPATRLVKGLEDAEGQARAAGLGLWRDPNPMPPWEWRQLAAAGKLPAPPPPPEPKKETESAFDRLVKIPRYGNTQDGLLKTVVEARQRQDAIEESARQSAILRRQQAAYSYNPYYGMESSFGYDPYFGNGNYGGMGFSRGGNSRSYNSNTYGSGSWSYFPQASITTTPYMTYSFPNFSVNFGGYNY